MYQKRTSELNVLLPKISGDVNLVGSLFESKASKKILNKSGLTVFEAHQHHQAIE